MATAVELPITRPLASHSDYSEADYLDIDRRDVKRIELVDGRLEHLPMPTVAHKRIMMLLYRLLFTHVETAGTGGEMFVSAIPVWLGKHRFRQPDVVYLSRERGDRMEAYPGESEWLIEVVNEDHKKPRTGSCRGTRRLCASRGPQIFDR